MGGLVACRCCCCCLPSTIKGWSMFNCNWRGGTGGVALRVGWNGVEELQRAFSSSEKWSAPTSRDSTKLFTDTRQKDRKTMRDNEFLVTRVAQLEDQYQARHGKCEVKFPFRSCGFSSPALSRALACCLVQNGGKARDSTFGSSRRMVARAGVFAQEICSAEDSKGIEEVEKEAPHVPVLLEEVVSYFEGRQLLSFVDCTLGAAGHASAIISEHPEMERFIGMDVDPVAHAEARPRLQHVLKSRLSSGTSPTLNLHLVHTNFRNIKKSLEEIDSRLENGGVDGILMDLGMSSMQVNEGDRGFSFMREGPADMRMDPTGSLTAEEILNSWPEAEVGRILRDFGEERRWRHVARKIVEARMSGGIHTTSQLVEIIGGSSFARTGKNGRLKPCLHPATRTFQALRIAVNDELKSLELALSDAFSCLAPGGRLQVISFHSLEDRIVKQFFLNAAGLHRTEEKGQEFNFGDVQEYTHIPGETRHSKYIRKKTLENEFGEGAAKTMKNVVEGKNARVLTKKPLSPSNTEMSSNPRSRSAKLRVIEKK